MTICLNGKSADNRGAATVAELAARYHQKPHTILIEHNGVALHQREWISHRLAEGDRLEFVRVVAGG